MQSLERGLAVLEAFTGERRTMTISQAARATGTTRATARRILLTLQQLGFLRSEAGSFALTPRALSLGWAYLSSLNLSELAEPAMRRLTEDVGESCSIATLDIPDVVYVARVPTKRIMTIALGVGSRLPAYATSMGRVLLAAATADELDAYLLETTFEALTERTVTAPETLRELLQRAEQQGWALVDQELELGLRSVAAPICRSDGRVLAALNVSAPAARVPLEQIRSQILPALLLAAAEITTAIAHGTSNFHGRFDR